MFWLKPATEVTAFYTYLLQYLHYKFCTYLDNHYYIAVILYPFGRLLLKVIL